MTDNSTSPPPARVATTWFGVVLDALDGPALAHFYARLLGWTIFHESPEWTTLAPSEDAGHNLAFASEPLHRRPVWPTVQGVPQMQLHLDLEVADVEGAVAWGLHCGAELAEHQPQEDVRVMIDPAGHPFCFYLAKD